MSIDHQISYDSAQEFFFLEGSVVMKLSTAAAIGVCEQATEKDLIVWRVEGGIWRNPGFDARVDCIWDGADSPVEFEAAEKNNIAAANFIRSKSSVLDVFIITADRRHGDE